MATTPQLPRLVEDTAHDAEATNADSDRVPRSDAFPLDAPAAAAPDLRAQRATAPPPPAPSRRSIIVHFAIGLAVWACVIWGFVSALPSHDVDILLGVKTSGSPQITGLIVEGQVLRHGKPISSDGSVQIVIDDPRLSRHLESSVLPVSTRGIKDTSGITVLAPGSFRQSYAIAPPADGSDSALRIKAVFRGSQENGLAGQAVAYANCSSRIHAEDLIAGFLGIAALALLMIILFTGDLTQETAKFLFGATYLTCFLSVTAPLVVLLVVSNNRYLVELMRTSPVGLVEAKAEGVEHRQWFLNVGGLISETLPAEESKAASDASPAGATESVAAVGAPPTVKKAEQTYEIKGGLAIPFYVIILGVLGAGISMMRNVPNIQKDHIGSLKTTRTNPVMAVLTMLIAPFLRLQTHSMPTEPGSTEQHAGCDVRKKVIDQYMYLLSAPFLAIAVYYLLKIVADNVTEPVLVLMAFSTGLISEGIISSIVSFANRTLGNSTSGSSSAKA